MISLGISSESWFSKYNLSASISSFQNVPSISRHDDKSIFSRLSTLMSDSLGSKPIGVSIAVGWPERYVMHRCHLERLRGVQV